MSKSRLASSVRQQRSQVVGALIVVVASSLSAGVVRAQASVFADGFEARVVPCVSGQAGGGALDAPNLTGATLLGCFEVRNDGPARGGALARSGLPIPRDHQLLDTQLDRVVVIGPGGRRWPADVRVLSRWGRPLSDQNAAIRWLDTAIAVDLSANQSARFALYRAAAMPLQSDPGALQWESFGGDRFRVDTGRARFEIDARHPMPIRRVEVLGNGGTWVTISESTPANPGGFLFELSSSVEAATASTVHSSNDPQTMQVLDVRWQLDGEVSLAVHIDGVLSTAGTPLPCLRDRDFDGSPDIDGVRHPYSLTLRMTRGSADLEADLHFVNACGTERQAPDAESVGVRKISLELPFAGNVGVPFRTFSSTNALPEVHLGSQRVTVSQTAGQTGDGLGVRWRHAERHGSITDVFATAESWSRPAVGLLVSMAGGQESLVMMATQPWMRFREPQSLRARASGVEVAFIDKPGPMVPVRVGKAKGLWFSTVFGLANAPGDIANAATVLPAMVDRVLQNSERPLLLRPLPESLDAAAILPPLSGSLGAESAFGNAYREYLETKHRNTVGSTACTDATADVGSQWTCAKTFGAQVWPDIQFNEQFGFQLNPTPAFNEPKYNYWDPVNIELMEFLRTGETRWAWDFALPQARLMAHTAYYNFGRYPNAAGATSNIAGHSFGSGGTGDGTWHRGDDGSADYTYNRSQALAYVLNPSVAHRDRLQAAGFAAAARFVNDPADDTTWAAVGRLNFQYLESLSNCAQFVPGPDGAFCDSRLREVLGRIIDVSLSSGLICERKLTPGDACFMGQYFMLYALYYPTLERLYLNFGHTLQDSQRVALRRALAESPRRLLASLPRRTDNSIEPFATWPNALNCSLQGIGFVDVGDCTLVPDPDNLTQNHPATLSLLARGHAWAGDPALCTAVRQLGSDLFAGGGLGPLQATARGGWWKGAVESGQELLTAALGAGTCLPQRLADQGDES